MKPRSSSPADDCGALLKPQDCSPSDTWTPDSVSNSSRYACPLRLGSGRVKATSALTSKVDGAVDRRGMMLLRKLVGPLGLKCSSVLAPPTRLADASKPSGGRL